MLDVWGFVFWQSSPKMNCSLLRTVICLSENSDLQLRMQMRGFKEFSAAKSFNNVFLILIAFLLCFMQNSIYVRGIRCPKLAFFRENTFLGKNLPCDATMQEYHKH